MMLLTVATCVAVSAASSCLSLHAGSPHTPQNLYLPQLVGWSPSADNVSGVVVPLARIRRPKLTRPWCWMMACFVALRVLSYLGLYRFCPSGWFHIFFVPSAPSCPSCSCGPGRFPCLVVSCPLLWSCGSLCKIDGGHLGRRYSLNRWTSLLK